MITHNYTYRKLEFEGDNIEYQLELDIEGERMDLGRFRVILSDQNSLRVVRESEGKRFFYGLYDLPKLMDAKDILVRIMEDFCFNDFQEKLKKDGQRRGNALRS
jgi:hypothetical protein